MPEGELLDKNKHRALIKKLGLGRSYNMEEISLSPVTSSNSNANAIQN